MTFEVGVQQPAAALTRGAHTDSTPEERLQYARSQLELARWMRESGVSREEAVRELADRATRGEPPPWKG